MPIVRAVCISEKTGEKKVPVASITLVENLGVAGDAHAGTGRQVSLLDWDSMEKVRLQLASVGPGAFAENLTVEGLNALGLGLGSRIKAGDSVILEITQIGKTCHHGCAIKQTTGSCIMPTHGIFGRVVTEGVIRPGDEIMVEPPTR